MRCIFVTFVQRQVVIETKRVLESIRLLVPSRHNLCLFVGLIVRRLWTRWVFVWVLLVIVHKLRFCQETSSWPPRSFHCVTVPRLVHVRFLFLGIFQKSLTLSIVLLELGSGFPPFQDSSVLLGIDKRRTRSRRRRSGLGSRRCSRHGCKGSRVHLRGSSLLGPQSRSRSLSRCHGSIQGRRRS